MLGPRVVTLSTVALSIGLCAAGSRCWAADYEFTRLAGPDDLTVLRAVTDGPFFSGPGTDRDGTVVVRSETRGGQALFRGNGATVTQIVGPSVPGIANGRVSTHSVSPDGRIAFTVALPLVGDAVNPDLAILVRAPGGALSELYRSDLDMPGRGRPQGVAVSSGGAIAWYQIPRITSTGQTTNDNGRIVTGDAELLFEDPAISNYSGPVLSDSGDAAFVGRVAGSPFHYVVQRVGIGGGATTTIGDSRDGDFLAINAGCAVDDAGLVYFPATIAGGNRILFAGGGADLQPLVDCAATQFQFIWSVGVNGAGQWAFTASLDSEELAASSLYVGTDPDTDRVVGTGDSLDGRTVSNIGLGADGVNQSGQIVFLARFTDGTGGYYRADPIEAGAGPLSGFLVPTRVTYESGSSSSSPRLTAAGTFDSGGSTISPAGAATVRVGPFGFALAGVSKVADDVWSGPSGTLRIRPGALGSRTTFAIDLADEQLADIDPDGVLELTIEVDGVVASARVPLVDARFKSKRAGLLAPRVRPVSAKAKVKRPGKDALKLKFDVSALGDAPATAPDVVLTLGGAQAGDVLSATSSPAGFKGKRTKWQFSGAFGGGTARVVVNYKKNNVTIAVKKLDLSALPDPGTPLQLEISVGGVRRSFELRLGGKATSQKY